MVKKVIGYTAYALFSCQILWMTSLFQDNNLFFFIAVILLFGAILIIYPALNNKEEVKEIETMGVQGFERLNVGDYVTHFKRNTEDPKDFSHCYQILAKDAKHTETGELLLVYQAMYGVGEVFCRPMNMAFSEVDREKYPEAKQQFRLEKIEVSPLLRELQSTILNKHIGR